MVWKRRAFDKLATPSTRQNPKTPQYVKIAAILRAEIVDGTFSHGEALPGEAALAERFEVSRLTIRRALETLALDNLVFRRPGPGNGTRVNFPDMRSPDQRSMSDLLLHYSTLGNDTRVEVVSFETLAAGEQIAAALDCDPQAPVRRLVRRRFISGRPFSLFTTYVPEAIGRNFDQNEIREAAIVTLIERQGFEIKNAVQNITACIADDTLSDLLSTAVGDALINVRRVTFAKEHGPVEYISVIYLPSDYNYQISLVRSRANDSSYWSLEGTI